MKGKKSIFNLFKKEKSWQLEMFKCLTNKNPKHSEYFLVRKYLSWLAMVVYANEPSTGEAEAGRRLWV